MTNPKLKNHKKMTQLGSESHEEVILENKLLLSNVEGSILWYNSKDGYGFIIRDDTEEGVFFHKSEIRNNISEGYKPKEKVKFDIVQGIKGMQVANVIRLSKQSLVTSKEKAENLIQNHGSIHNNKVEYKFKEEYNNEDYSHLKSSASDTPICYPPSPSDSEDLDNEKKELDYNKHIADIDAVKSRQSNWKREQKKTLTENITGFVIFYNEMAGYGFIKREDRNQTVFFHHSEICNESRKKFSHKETVKFDVVRGLKGFEASNIRSLNENSFLTSLNPEKNSSTFIQKKQLDIKASLRTPENNDRVEKNSIKQIPNLVSSLDFEDLEFEDINTYENVKGMIEIEKKKIEIYYKDENQSYETIHNLYIISINKSEMKKKIHWIQVASIFEINPLAFKRLFLNNLKYPLKKCILKYKLNEHNKILFEFIEKKLNVSLNDYGDSKETTLILKDSLNEICNFIFNPASSLHFKELLKQL